MNKDAHSNLDYWKGNPYNKFGRGIPIYQLRNFMLLFSTGKSRVHCQGTALCLILRKKLRIDVK